jgi:Rad3-related DNA helicase
MSKIYNFCRDSDQKLGLFSSPTGTGKSLSLICSILSFYLDKNITPGGNTKNTDADDWEQLFAKTKQLQIPKIG